MFWNKRKVFWTQNEVYAKAFRTLAWGLWLMLGGMAAILIAALIFCLPLVAVAAVPQLKEWTQQIILTATGFLVVGTLLNLWGKWTCFELQQPLEHGQPLPGHRYLQIAFWCEMISFVLRSSSRMLGVAQLRFLNLPLAIISQVVFLLFLRKLADVISRPELKRRIDYLGVSVAGCAVAFGIAQGARALEIQPRLILIALFVSCLLFLVSLVGYIVLLMQFAFAARTFAKFLEESSNFDYDDDDEPELAAEPAG